MEVRVNSAPWWSGIEILVKDGDSFGKSVIMEKADPGSAVIKPTITISMQAAQVLMDDLWHSGIRPTEGSGSSGSLRATERHLSDMRKIAFKTLNLDY